jgi:CHASE3 domain sensor protein
MASLLFCGAFFYNRIKVLDSAFDSVTQSVRIKQKLRQVEAEISTCESAQRGFLLTGDSVFLEHFNEAIKHSRQAADTISLLTAANPDQAAHAAEMQQLLDVRIHLLKKTIDSTGFNQADITVKKTFLLNGKKIMDSLLDLSDKMLIAENELLEERKKYRDEARELTPKYVLGILLFSLLIVSGCYYALLRFHRKKMAY